MKKIFLSYSAPQIDIFEVVAERGYSVSGEVLGGTAGTLPSFGTEEDSLVY